jgi:hypothetical protein
MPITPEERARIARENGAKSKGPVTQEGKDRSRLNSLKDGKYAETLASLLPPDEAVTALEDRREFVVLVHELMSQYQPVNQLALGVVIDIATATWQIRRYRCLITAQWNLAAINEASKPTNLPAELQELSVVTGAARALHTGDKLALVYNREIANLQKSIAGLERRLKFIHANFNAPVTEAADRPEDAWLQAEPEERTQPESEPPVENTDVTPQQPQKPAKEPLVIYENDPRVIQAYRTLCPDREIVVMPSGPDGAAPLEKGPKAA